MLFIHFPDDAAGYQEEKEYQKTYTVFRKVNQIVAQPYFHHYRRNFTNQRSFQVFSASLVRTARAVNRILGE